MSKRLVVGNGSETSRDLPFSRLLELLDEVVDETAVEVLTTEVGIASSSLDLKNTLLNGKQRLVEDTSTKIEDERSP